MFVAGSFGVAVAARHVWIQAQPKGAVASCGMSLDYMIESLPFTDVVGKVFAGSGECAEAGWLFLDLGIPAWTLVFFVAMTVAALALVAPRLKPAATSAPSGSRRRAGSPRR